MARKMAKEDPMARLEKVIVIQRNSALVAAEAVREGMQKHLPKKQINPLKKALANAVDELNESIGKAYYRSMVADHGMDAVREILKAPNCAVPGAVKYSIKENDEGVVTLEEVPDPSVRVDLTKFRAEVGVEYFHNDGWFDLVNHLARLMAVKLNANMRGADVYKYTVAESAKALDFDVDADDDAQMIAAFQAAIDGILWAGSGETNDIRFDKSHLTYIRTGFASLDKKSTNGVLVVTPARTLEFVCCAINVILNGAQYKVSTKK